LDPRQDLVCTWGGFRRGIELRCDPYPVTIQMGQEQLQLLDTACQSAVASYGHMENPAPSYIVQKRQQARARPVVASATIGVNNDRPVLAMEQVAECLDLLLNPWARLIGSDVERCSLHRIDLHNKQSWPICYTI
jgi:hypothetical protein